MAIDRTRYRQLEFIGARILQARELNWLQEMDQNVSVTDDETPVSGVLQTIYRQGAMYNITVSVTGLNVTLSATNGGQPMYIFVRDRWEIFPGQNDDCHDSVNGTQPGNATMTLTGVETTIFLNWELRIRTGGLTGDDPSLTDSITNEATASAGELILHLSDVDTSGTPLGGNQLATNTSPIPMLTFTNSGTVLTYVPTDNAQSQAQGGLHASGLVRTTTPTPIVVSTDDPRLGSASSVSDGSVHDSTVRTPIAAGGTNSNGTPTYKLPINGGTDIGGISAAKIILLSTTQLLEDGWNWLVSNFNNLLNAFNAHATAALGLVNTHPLPTAAQIGAAPISHVGQALGLVTSHPPVVNQNSGGFRVNQSVTGAANDPGYGVFTSGTNIGSINHDGDHYSLPANSFTASPGGTGITITGALGLMSKIAGVVSQHVNQVSHANPHGLTAGDIGALTASSITSLRNAKGYIIIPTSVGSLIVQWTTGNPIPCNTSGAALAQTVNWPIAFPTACLWASVSTEITDANSLFDALWQTVGAPTRTGQLIFLGQVNNELSSHNTQAYLLAVGY